MQRKPNRVPGRPFWRSEPRWALAAVGMVTLLFGLWMFGITWLRHRAWFSQNYDIGIFDQAMWLLSHLREPFVTVRVINVFGDHASFNLVVLAPFYRLWPWSGPSFLYAVHALALSACVPALYRLSRRVGASPLFALAVAVAFCMNPLVQNTGWEFHPEALSLPFLIYALVFALDRRWLPFGVSVGVAMLAKEDMPMLVFFLGVWLLAVRRQRMAALWTMAAGLAVFLFDTRVLIPRVGGGGYLYYQRFREYGTGTVGVLVGMVTHFRRLLGDVLGQRGLRYISLLLSCLGPFVLLAPGILIPIAPTLVFNLLSNFDAQRSVENHYIAPALPFLMAAIAVGVARTEAILPRTRRAGAVILLVVLVPPLITNVMYSMAQPASPLYRPLLYRTAHTVRLEEAKRCIPDGASVSASHHLVAHMTDRPVVYLFPMPFEHPDYQQPQYRGEDQQRRIRQLDYIFVDRNLVYYRQYRLEGLFPLPAGETWDTAKRFWSGWDILYDYDDILVARRPGAPVVDTPGCPAQPD